MTAPHFLPARRTALTAAVLLAFSAGAGAAISISPFGSIELREDTSETYGDRTTDLTVTATFVPALHTEPLGTAEQHFTVLGKNLTVSTTNEPLDTIAAIGTLYVESNPGLNDPISALTLEAAEKLSISLTSDTSKPVAALRTETGAAAATLRGQSVDISVRAPSSAAGAQGLLNQGTETVLVDAAGNLTIDVYASKYVDVISGNHTRSADPADRGSTTALTAGGDITLKAGCSSGATVNNGVYMAAHNTADIEAGGKISITVDSDRSAGFHQALQADGASSAITLKAGKGLMLLARNAIVTNEGSVTVTSEAADNLITGDIVTVNGGMLSLRLGGGTIEGDILSKQENLQNWSAPAHKYQVTEDGQSIIGLSGVTWKMSGHNNDVTMLLSEGSTIQFYNDNHSSPDETPFGQLTLGAFDGSNNTFVMRADLNSDAAGTPALDVLTINDEHPVSQSDPTRAQNLTNTVKVLVLGTPDDEQVMHAVNASVINNNPRLTMTLKTEGGYVDGSTDRWVLRWAADEADLETDSPARDLSATGTGGQWFLVRQTAADDTPEGNMVQTLGTGLSGYLTYKRELETLGDRLGAVRNTGDAGLWVRVSGDKAHAKGASGLAFKQTDVSVTLGADGKVWEGGNRTVIAGGAFKAGRSNLDGAAAKADVNHYSLKGYATMMNANGAYVDAVLQTGVYTHDMKGRSNTGLQSVTGDYNTFGFGASLEAGHRFGFAKHFYVEPSMQLSWFHLKGRDYTLSTGMNAAAGSADFLTGRLGVTAGWESVNGTAGTGDFSRKALAVRTGLNRDFRAKQNVVTGDVTEKLNARGTSVYYGLEGTWTMGNTSLFAVVDREEGNKYRRDFGVKAGVRYAF